MIVSGARARDKRIALVDATDTQIEGIARLQE